MEEGNALRSGGGGTGSEKMHHLLPIRCTSMPTGTKSYAEVKGACAHRAVLDLELYGLYGIPLAHDTVEGVSKTTPRISLTCQE